MCGNREFSQVHGPDLIAMSKRTIAITGASDGIGAAAARKLTNLGHEVIVIGRSPRKTEAVAADIGARFHFADFSRLAEVRTLADTLRSEHPQIDVLINNAGGVMGNFEVTEDGFEKTLQVNHLAPFLLTNLLLDRLVENAATVLNTSSVAAKVWGNIDLDDLDNHRKYSPNKAYGDGKLANILFTRELHRRFHTQGVNSAAFHPGTVATNFASESTSALRFVYRTPLRRLVLTSVDKGSKNLVWLADANPGVDWQSGEFYVKTHVAKTNPQAYDTHLAKSLWDTSAQMVGLA
jgi:NAD(P)-dependent dehydrogenase (short-subunit alcohol dehydrogenase family)